MYREQAKGGDPFPLYPTGEATPGALCPVLGSPVQEIHGLTAASPVQGHKDDKGIGASSISGKAERAGKKRLRGDLTSVFKYLMGGNEEHYSSQ